MTAKTPLLPTANLLLAALPPADLQRIARHLQSVPLPLGWALYEADERMEYVYFPTMGIVSLLSVMQNGATAEIAVTGNEGLVGISIFMGGDSTPGRAVVQSAGHAYRLPAQLLKQEFDRGGDFQHLLLRFTQALITQMAQTSVCNRYHKIEQQLSRWLLLSLDRVQSMQLLMTQDLIADMLGVRREGVAVAAKALQEAGLIFYRRGRIEVLDRSGLEQAACECYSVVKQETDRLLAKHEAASPTKPRGRTGQ